MAIVTKIGEGKSDVTRDNTTLHGLTNVTSDSTRNELSFFAEHTALLAVKFEEITDNHGTANAKELGDYYLANGYFLGTGAGGTVDLSVLEASNAAIQAATEASAVSLAAIETDAAAISANTLAAANNTADISADTGNIATDTAGILADTAVIETNTGLTATNTGNTATNTAGILTDTGVISANSGLILADTTAILADTGNIETSAAGILADTGTIVTNTASIAASALLGATAANQTTGNNSLSSIDSKVSLASKQDTQITLATTANTLLSQIQTNTAGGVGSESNIKLDVAGKAKIANLETDIDIKFRYDKQPLIFDEVINGLATSVHEPDNSSVNMSVNLNAQYVIRQTFERFNYQSGKPKVGTFTFVNIAPQAGTIKRVGLYNGGTIAPYNVTDGVYLESNGTVISVCAAFLGVVFSVPQSSWTDKLDGTGASGVIVDWTKSQILFIEYLWLGYGPVRFSLEIGSELIDFHTINYGANTQSIPYMSSPNQPVRYEIRSTGGTGSFKQTCSTVGTSGGRDTLGIERGVDTGSAFENVTLALANTTYLIYSTRLQATKLDAQIKILNYNMLITSKDDFIYYFLLNPTVTGVVTHTAQTNSAVEIAHGNGTQLVSGGTIISCGVGFQQAPVSANIANVLRLGHQIDGTPTRIVLAIKPLTPGAIAYAYLNRLESI